VTVDGKDAVNAEADVNFEDDDEDGAAERLGLEVASLLREQGAQNLLDRMKEAKERMEKATDVGDKDTEKTAVELLSLPIFKEASVNGN
jgi:hypothetical protein